MITMPLVHEACRANIRASVNHLRHGSDIIENLIQNAACWSWRRILAGKTGVVDSSRICRLRTDKGASQSNFETDERHAEARKHMSDIPAYEAHSGELQRRRCPPIAGPTCGIVITEVSDSRVAGELAGSWNPSWRRMAAYIRTIVTLSRYRGGIRLRRHNLPAEATWFPPPSELKSNHLGTARDGTIIGVATPVAIAEEPHRCGMPSSFHKESRRTFSCISLQPK